MPNQIKACPFCGATHTINSVFGSDVELVEELWDYYFIVCDASKGGCGSVGGAGEDLNKAIKKWNRRNG